MNATHYADPTQRPIFINLINNLDCEEPRITIKRDNEFPDFGGDVEVPLAKVPDEIEKRNKSTSEPIYVRYEYKYCWNMLLIDTPGLKQPGEEGEEERENLVLELAKPQERTLVFVEDAKDWSEVQVEGL